MNKPQTIIILAGAAFFLLFLTAGAYPVMARPSSLTNISGLPRKVVRELSARDRAMKIRGMDAPLRVFPTQGSRKVLVILVQFPDLSNNTVSTASFYSNLFNGTNSNQLSFRKYYQDMSGGRLNLQFIVAGPFTSRYGWRYYGSNTYGYDAHPAELAGEAVDLAYSNGLDYSPFDNDNDGKVEAVIVIHAGPGEESGADADAIWSHRWSLEDAKTNGDGTGQRTYSGKTINDYSMQPEYINAAGDSTVGVFCHEFGHLLGLPDLYDVSYETAGVGYWSLMSAGSWLGPRLMGECPAPLLAWEKAKLGWISVMNADQTAFSPPPSGRLSQGQGPILAVPGPSLAAAAVLIILLAMAAAVFSLRKNPVWRYLSIQISVACFLMILPFLTYCSFSPGTGTADGKTNAGGGPGTSTNTPPAVYTNAITNIETGFQAVRVPLGDPGGRQYLLLENKVRAPGTWAEFLPGDGLLVTLVDLDYLTAAHMDSNDINTYRTRIHGIEVFEADNNWKLWYENYGEPSDTFFDGNNASLTPVSCPAVFYYTGTDLDTAGAGVYIENISGKGQVMTFTYHR